MSNLVVIVYDDPFTADQVRLDMQRMEADHLVDLEDAAVAVKNEDGKEAADKLQPGTSALFLLTGEARLAKVLPELAQYDGTILQTNLPPEDEERPN